MAKQKRQPLIIVPPRDKTVSLPSYLTSEASPVWTDYINQTVGALAKYTAASGVYLHKDRVLITQTYQELAQYDLYDEVERDPHIAGVLQTRKNSVAGLEWSVVAASDSPQDKEIAQFCEDALYNIEDFQQDMIQFLDAVGKGFSVGEIMWGQDKRGFIVPIEIKNRPQRRFQFDAETMLPKLRTLQNPFYGDPLPDRKFIIHRNSQMYEVPFGDPIDQKIFWMWLFKRNNWKFWGQFTESNAGPIPVGSYPPGADDILKAELSSFVQSFRSASSGIKPNNAMVEFIEPKSSSSTASSYELFGRFINDEISKCVLGQVLTTEASGSSGSGSKALGQVHNTVRKDIMEYDAKALANTFNRTLIRWMVDFNYPGVEEYPDFEFTLEEDFDLVASSQTIKNLSDAGFKFDPKDIEDKFGFELLKDEKGNYVTGAPKQPTPFGA